MHGMHETCRRHTQEHKLLHDVFHSIFDQMTGDRCGVTGPHTAVVSDPAPQLLLMAKLPKHLEPMGKGWGHMPPQRFRVYSYQATPTPARTVCRAK